MVGLEDGKLTTAVTAATATTSAATAVRAGLVRHSRAPGAAAAPG
jgi:hypothetical protein